MNNFIFGKLQFYYRLLKSIKNNIYFMQKFYTLYVQNKPPLKIK